jgi:hypothetical protein
MSPPKRHSSRPAATPLTTATRPEVILDFHVDQGLLFVVLKNVGLSSAYRIVTRFDRGFRGMGGSKDMSKMALFRTLQFMPPGKQFLQLIDPIAAYLGRQEPMRLDATVTYLDRDGKRYEEVIPHDLEIYRDFGEVKAC